MLRWWFIIVAALLLALPARAHKPSDSYLTLSVAGNTVSGHWDIALRDLDFALGLDADGDGAITWGELRAKHDEIAAYALARLALQADGAACTLEAGPQLVDEHTDGAYTVLQLRAACPQAPARLSVSYSLFADLDPQHRGLLNLQTQGTSRSAVLGPQAPTQHFEMAAISRLAQFADYVREGVWHIWIGFDHILFLLSLLLPAVVVWQGGAWRASEGYREPLWEVVKTVTAFTVAHSITLSLATLGVVSLPSRWVESAIAASVILAALNNVVPVMRRGRWMMAFAFGLIHGFGFATVLSDLGLPGDALLLALVAFNVGVELGQLAIVVLFFPLAFSLRRTWLYRKPILLGGSLAIMALAGVWLGERLFDVQLLAGVVG